MIPDFSGILKKLSNPFIKLTDNEKQELKKIEVSVKKDIKEFAQIAKELFQDERYAKLKKEFVRIYDQCINLLIYYDCDDIQKYAFKMREYQIELRKLKSIFDTPEGFIREAEKMENRKE